MFAAEQGLWSLLRRDNLLRSVLGDNKQHREDQVGDGIVPSEGRGTVLKGQPPEATVEFCRSSEGRNPEEPFSNSPRQRH